MKIDGANILVTGGCGLIGSTTIEQLLANHQPARIVILDNLARGSLAQMATIDRRLDEPGVVACAERLGLPLRGFAADELAAVWPLPTPSDVVHAAVGTYGVCEPAALLASGADTLLVPKVKTARATAAVARMVGA